MSSNKDEMLICPFDASHTIRRIRMAVHLQRCERNHAGSKMVRCPFNSTHLMEADEIKKHCENCPDRLKFEDFLSADKKPKVALCHQVSGKIRCPHDEAKANGEKRQNRSESAPHADIDKENKGDVGCTENWDDEPDVPTYDPRANWNDKFLILNPQGLSPAAKRAFREQERNRFLSNGKF
ncbi:gametocyte-specific factor 1 homolog [Drosophila pseudoobscura]|uniref:Gametocyte-specific factor 1 homolog n=1 Tax=Drosophila pseudoobscura pseudoobscura TaxID=46245 RepID=A0A6I8VEE1_DROPS|nr:gametocyte-specific factor 1 homolog [Drosophila pseudoobscura]